MELFKNIGTSERVWRRRHPSFMTRDRLPELLLLTRRIKEKMWWISVDPGGPTCVMGGGDDRVDVTGDGDCLFHAIIRCMAHRKHAEDANMSLLAHFILSKGGPTERTKLVEWFRNMTADQALKSDKVQKYIDFHAHAADAAVAAGAAGATDPKINMERFKKEWNGTFWNKVLQNNICREEPWMKNFRPTSTIQDCAQYLSDYVRKKGTWSSETSFTVLAEFLDTSGVKLEKMDDTLCKSPGKPDLKANIVRVCFVNRNHFMYIKPHTEDEYIHRARKDRHEDFWNEEGDADLIDLILLSVEYQKGKGAANAAAAAAAAADEAKSTIISYARKPQPFARRDIVANHA
jgi:hypothetical protein